jgi:hypothetical protein
MDGPGAAGATFYRPMEVARMLRCSEWWVKEQARQRRIPYAWIGGGYLFTDEHVKEIVRRFEVLPADEPPPAPRLVRAEPAGDAPAALRPRVPRRARDAGSKSSAA